MKRATPALGAGLLLLCGVLLAWPILTGGWLTYLDNPAHVAEIHSLAFDDGGGWSDIAWCGYPLGRLHSPVWFGWFAHLVRAGLALGPVYAFMVVLGFLAPPLVLFGVARVRAGIPAALLLAWLLLVQKTSLVGFGSPLGGMWTFYLSCGALLLLIRCLAADRDRVVHLFVIAGLYGFIGLTHLFTLVPGVIIFAVHAATRLARRKNRRFLLAQALAAGLGAVASSAYWAPLFLAGDGVAVIAYNLPPLKLLARLFLGTSVAELRKVDADLMFQVSPAMVLPMILLVVSGVAGFLVNIRNRAGGRVRLSDYGFLLAVVVLVILLVLGLFQSAGRDINWLGHVSWRLLYFVRLGLAMAAIPLFSWIGVWPARWKGTLARGGTAAAGAVLLVLFSVGLGAPLRAVSLDSNGGQMQEVRRLWTWLGENRASDWGRVYLQDTFGKSGPLGSSHVLALTRRETGIDQVGPLYEGSPFPTVPWLVAESRKLFGRPMHSAEDFVRMQELIPAANVTRLVLNWPELAAEMVRKGYARYEYRSENFAVLALADYRQGRWAEPLDSRVSVVAKRLGTGRWQVTTDATESGGAVLLKVSWSPHWRVVRGESAVVGTNEIGLISLDARPAGRHLTILEYRQPRWPDLVSFAGWGLWLVLLAAWRFVPAFKACLAAIEGGSP